jgi:hypothetical protein
MNLEDGLQRYKQDAQYWQLTLDIEQASQKVLSDLKRYDNEPAPAALQTAKDLLLNIEKWKAMCLPSRMKNAKENSPKAVWKAFLRAINARSDVDAVRSIMDLKGFGSSTDAATGQRRAKVATAVLRFLNPEDWGVVDWRTCTMLDEMEKHAWNTDRAIKEARGLKAQTMRNRHDIVNEAMVCERNLQYRAKRSSPPLSRAADIDMALFGLSLHVWPLRQ